MSKRPIDQPPDEPSRPLPQDSGRPRPRLESLSRHDIAEDPAHGTALYEAIATQDTSDLTPDEWLDRLEAIVRTKSRLAAMEAQAVAAFDDSLHGISADLGHRHPQPGDRHATPGERRWIAGDLRSVSDEIALILTMNRGSATARIHTSCELVHNFAATLHALTEGHLTERAAFTIVSELSILDDINDIRAAEAAILDWIHTHDLTKLKEECRREVARRSPAATDKAHNRAHDERSVRMYTNDNGRADIIHNQTTLDASAIMTSLSRAAAHQRRNGDPRTMDQLRADIATNRLLPRSKRPGATPTNAHPTTHNPADTHPSRATHPDTNPTNSHTTPPDTNPYADDDAPFPTEPPDDTAHEPPTDPETTDPYDDPACSTPHTPNRNPHHSNHSPHHTNSHPHNPNDPSHDTLIAREAHEARPHDDANADLETRDDRATRDARDASPHLGNRADDEALDERNTQADRPGSNTPDDRPEGNGSNAQEHGTAPETRNDDTHLTERANRAGRAGRAGRSNEAPQAPDGHANRRAPADRDAPAHRDEHTDYNERADHNNHDAHDGVHLEGSDSPSDEAAVGVDATVVIHATAAEVQALITGEISTGGEADRHGPIPQSLLRKQLLKALTQTLLPNLPTTPNTRRPGAATYRARTSDPTSTHATTSAPDTTNPHQGSGPSGDTSTRQSSDMGDGANPGQGSSACQGDNARDGSGEQRGDDLPPTGGGSRVELRIIDQPPDQDPDKYTPTAATDRYVRWRDRTCQFPGCNRPAEFTDLDHRVAFAAGGRTTAANLWCLCRHHHRLKHEGGWQIYENPDGSYTWISPTGRQYRNNPTDPSP